MQEHAERLAPGALMADDELERDFEARLVDSSTLAFRVAFSVTRHREDAEDVAQEALIRAHRSFRHLRDRERFRAWLVRVTWRLALDRQRANRRRVTRELSAQTAAPSTPDDSAEAAQLAADVWEAIDALPPKLRLAIVLASIEGHDVGEVGRLLRLPEGTVKSRLFLARQRMKEHLQWIRHPR